MDGILISLKLMGYGLAGTFFSLLLLYLLILVTRRVLKPKHLDTTEGDSATPVSHK